MKVSYILVLSLPLMNALFNNNTGTCQCVCQKQNLGDTGFHACIHKWCLQSGTKQQYTKCQSVSVDGRTCYNPSIKYGSTIGGIPNKHWQNVYKEWCQQLFPTSNIIKSSVTYSNYKPTNFIGSVFWCRSYDETSQHWCDFQDGHWKDSTLDYKSIGSQVINSLTCQI